jgi:N-acetyltransferase 10
MGFGLAAALAKGVTNIFVTAPAPENLTTFFEFAIKGLELLGFKPSIHFEVIKSSTPNGERTLETVIRINFFATHKQIVQYFDPVMGENLQFADLLIIDEAAAIPLPVVKKMLGKCPAFISSTVHGYEGTGRSLSLKLIKQLKTAAMQDKGFGGEFPFKEVKMEEPIRYSTNDPIERWLYDLLLLDVSDSSPGHQGRPSERRHAAPVRVPAVLGKQRHALLFQQELRAVPQKGVQSLRREPLQELP